MSERQHSRSRRDTGSSTIPQIEIQAPSSRVSTTKSLPRDTGFPETFDKGTTLPHPDADLSPNATLSSDDVSTERILKRHRLSFLKKNKKRTVSHGTLDPHSEALRSGVSLSRIVSSDENSQDSASLRAGGSSSSLRLSRDGDDSLHSGPKKGDDDTPPTSPDEHQRKPGLFNRWKRN
ncbi:hypothetical protein E4U21_003357 [Claviceps maximensis]|nr:hypothetical protein E4U21_003357 [Claviceps maximensis]